MVPGVLLHLHKPSPISASKRRPPLCLKPRPALQNTLPSARRNSRKSFSVHGLTLASLKMSCRIKLASNVEFYHVKSINNYILYLPRVRPSFFSHSSFWYADMYAHSNGRRTVGDGAFSSDMTPSVLAVCHIQGNDSIYYYSTTFSGGPGVSLLLPFRSIIG